jgi:cysteine desulfurase / selenocysteine lyase
VNALGLEAIADYEHSLMHYALEALQQVPTLKIYGPADRAGVIRL